jgi:S-adenosylmethionine hydrolase
MPASPAEKFFVSSTLASPPSGLITLLTDFGNADGYVAAMKGVILGIFPGARVVDLSHEVEPQQIAAGAFLLAAHFKFFPAGTVHVAVVDPGVGTARAPLACWWANHYFVAPDNGLLDFCAEQGGGEAVRLTQPQFWRSEVSHTFHGRDVFAPVAAHLAAGVSLYELGEPMQLTRRLSSSVCEVKENVLIGEVIFIDRFGNLISNISHDELRRFAGDARVRIRLAGFEIGAVQPAYAEVPMGAPLALINSFGRLEIGVNQGSAKSQFHVSPGASITVERGA